MAVSGRKADNSTLQVACSGSEDDGKEDEQFCEPCEEDGQFVSAFGYCVDCKDFLCQRCFKYHRKARPFRDHRLFENGTIPHTLKLADATARNAGPMPQSDKVNTPCPKHKQELVKFYCEDDLKLLCTACVTIDHNDCHIKYISDISKQAIGSQELHETLEDIDDSINKCQKLFKSLKDAATKSNESLSNALKDIRHFKNELKKRLDAAEKVVKDLVMSKKTETDRKLEIIEAECDNIIEELNRSSDIIKHLNSSKLADNLFVELKTADALIENCEHNMNEVLQYGKFTEYIFKPNPNFISLLSEGDAFGALKRVATEQTGVLFEKKIPKDATPDGEITVKTDTDKEWCMISGMALVSHRCLAITDAINESIKLIDIDKRAVTTQMPMGTELWDVCKVGINRIAVTLPEKQTVHFLSISAGNLVKGRSFKVDTDCYGISYCKEKLVVTFENPAMVQILDMKGNTLSTIKTSDKRVMFKAPRYVKTDNERIIVSDSKKGNVFVLNWHGEIVSVYEDIDHPRGLDSVGNWSMLTCASSYIKEIFSDGSKADVVLRELKPSTVCWCSRRRQLFVSSMSYDKKNNVLQAFRLS